ncbi:hypothetical protein ACA910_018876 [Epithemia clementina (nom. ined.)]
MKSNMTRPQEQRWKRMRQAAQFLNETFPCAKFVVSIRSDAQSHAQSIRHTFYQHNQEKRQTVTVQESEQRNCNMRLLVQWLGQEKARVMDSSQWTRNMSIVNALVSNFLGFDPACHFKQLFQLNTHDKYNVRL